MYRLLLDVFIHVQWESVCRLICINTNNEQNSHQNGRAGRGWIPTNSLSLPFMSQVSGAAFKIHVVTTQWPDLSNMNSIIINRIKGSTAEKLIQLKLALFYLLKIPKSSAVIFKKLHQMFCVIQITTSSPCAGRKRGSCQSVKHEITIVPQLAINI